MQPVTCARGDSRAADGSASASRLAFISRLWSANGIRVVACILRGDPAEETLGFARSVLADLIACGQRARSIVERVLIGSTTRELLDAAECSVLVAPAGRSA
jgi:nucleotide-binding universal stress UspA family protein